MVCELHFDLIKSSLRVWGLIWREEMDEAWNAFIFMSSQGTSEVPQGSIFIEPTTEKEGGQL